MLTIIKYCYGQEEREQLTDKEKDSKPDNQDTENNTEAYIEHKEDKVIETAVSLHADSKSNR